MFQGIRNRRREEPRRLLQSQYPNAAVDRSQAVAAAAAGHRDGFGHLDDIIPRFRIERRIAPQPALSARKAIHTAPGGGANSWSKIVSAQARP